jgi:Holliday junction DNA helicase RuvA
MQIMRSRSLEAISRAISTQDIDFFSQVKGVGKKTASKIVLMLQDKVLSVKDSVIGAPSISVEDNDAKMALIKLGFHPNKVSDVLSRIGGGGLSTSALIRQALAELSE